MARARKATSHTNIVAEAPLVGRAIDRAALASLFDEGARLVSIIGPGGMGKTRLATSFAAEHAGAYSEHGDGGAWFCDCTVASSSADLCAAIAAVVGVKLGAASEGSALATQLARALARRGRVLLVLDNLEGLVASAAETIAYLVRAVPAARFLVTTRIALGIAGEYRWPLQGLDLPPPLDTEPALAALLAAPSVDLFVRRARQVRPDLVLDDPTVRAVASIATRLEGIPLAIELAAARVVALSPEQIRDRLGSDREILVRRSDDGRHGSMRTVVTDSLRLLDDRERSCLACCTLFEGGFTLEAATAVLGTDESGQPALVPLETLVLHSLLRMVAGPVPRFDLYEVIREAVEVELDARPELRATVLRLHLAYFLRLVESADLARIGDELQNLLRAHETALEDDTERGLSSALAIALAIDPVLEARGLFARRRALFDETILRARAIGGAGRRDFRDVLVARAHNSMQLGALESATQDLTEALAHADDPLEQARIHVRLGTIVETRGDTKGAREQLLSALASAKDSTASRAREIEAEAHAAIAHTYRREGRLDEAEQEIATALARYRALDDESGLSVTVVEAGVIALFRQQYVVAGARFDEALALARRLGARPREAAILTARGTLEQELGHIDTARELHEAAVAIFRDLAMAYSEASTLYYLAGTHLESGRSADGEAVLASALRTVRTIGVPRYEALMLGALAASRARGGAIVEAHMLLAEADALAEACQTEAPLLTTLAIHRLQLAPITKDVFAQAEALASRHACDDPRFALRLLVLPSNEVSAAALVVANDGTAVRLPGASSDVDLTRRAALARMLVALARTRVEQPGEVLRVDDLLVAGWPGERVRYDAGANRVYVALAELRKLGLREWLVKENGGYRLTTSRAVVLEPYSASKT
ncbi:MAG: AAA family ATPase [Labilithrix sp.]|nr:AAA family ATPase [Labilithrix sp.]